MIVPVLAAPAACAPAPEDAVRVEEIINYFDYDYPVPEQGGVPIDPGVGHWVTPWNAKHPAVFDTERSPGRH